MPSFDSCAFSTKSTGRMPIKDIRAAAKQYEADGLAPDAAMLRSLKDRLDAALLEEKRIVAAVRAAFDDSKAVRYSVAGDEPAKSAIASARTAAAKAAKAYDAYDKKVREDAKRGIEPSADEYFDISGAASDTEAAFAKALAELPNEGFALQATTRDGRMLMLNASAQSQGQWQLTRFGTDGAPWGDTNYPTKLQAITDFLNESDLNTVKTFDEDVRYSVSGDVTDSPAFKKWFGESAVVDEDGKPLMVFHGTDQDFDSFAKEKLGEATGAQSAAQGFFFVSRPDVATSYANYAAMQAPVRRELLQSERAEKRGDWDSYDAAIQRAEDLESEISDRPQRGQNVLPVYLSIKNPAVMDAEGELFTTLQDKINAFIKTAKRKGHDGVVLKNLDDDPNFSDRVGDHYIAFRPEQIKSAIGNSGEFSPDNPDIRYSASGDYRDEHTAPGRENGAPLSDLTGEGRIYPADVYSPNGPRYYGTGVKYDADAFRLAKMAKGKPDFDVMIYRAVPNDVNADINPGDWVAITRQYAVDHGESRFDGDYKILSKMVKASEIFTNGDSIQEWGYDPSEGDYSMVARPLDAGAMPAISPLIQKLADSGAVVVHADASTLPGGRAPAGVQALTEKDGTIHLVAASLTDSNARAVLLHEAFHAGAEKLIGTAQWNKLLARLDGLHKLAKGGKGQAREFYDKAAKRVAAAKARGAVAAGMELEEFGAYAIEEYESAPPSIQKWVNDLIGMVKAWALARFGKQLGDVTPAQLSGLARMALLDVAAERQQLAYSVNDKRTIEVDGVRHPIRDSRGELVAPDFMGQVEFWRKYTGPVDSEGRPILDGEEDAAPRYSVGAPRPAAAWTAPEATRIDKIVHTLQDKHIDMKRVVDEIRKTGAAIEDKWDPYLQEELFHGRSATGFKEFLNDELRPLLVDMQARGVKMEDFENYLVMRHAQETNEHIAAINPEMPDGGSGTMTADARAYLANLPATKKTAYQALAARVDAMVKSTQQVLLDYGLEKQEVIDAWNGAYKHYVPLQRLDMDTMLAGAGTGQGFSIRGSAAKRRTGSDKAVVDVLANLAMARERAIVRGEKNRLDLALYGLALKAPNPEFWRPVNPKKNPAGLQAELLAMGLPAVLVQNYMDEPTQKVVVKRAGGTGPGQQTIPGAAAASGEEVVRRVNTMLRSSPNVVAVRVNGEDRFIFFNDKDERALRMAMSLKNLTGGELNAFLNFIGKGTRWFASVNTQYNPIFGVVNLLRDAQAVSLNLTSTPLNGKQAAVMAELSRMLWKSGKKWFRLDSLTGADLADWQDFQREGGITGYRAMFANGDERAEELRKELTRMSAGKFAKAGNAVMDWLSDYNNALENVTRMAIYKVAKAEGMSAGQAASLAKNSSTNFNRRGNVGSQVGALYAFFNAAVQGTTRIAQTVDPRTKSGKAIIAGGLLLGTMQAVMLAAAGFEDDEPPEFIKAKNFVIPLGWASGKKDYATVPMPLGFNVLPSISRIATEFILGSGKKPAKHITNLAGAVLDSFNPIGHAGFSLQTVLPTVVDPLAALEANRDYTGKKIYNEDVNTTSPTPGHTRARGGASIPAKLASEGINAVLGGNDYVPGVWSPTPEHLEYLTGQLTGGVGREILKGFQTGQAMATGEELAAHRIPLAGRFYGTTEDGANVRARFMDNLQQLNLLEQEYEGRLEDKVGAKEFRAANPILTMADQAQAVQREVSKMGKEKRRLMEMGASRDRVRLMDDKMRGLMEKFNGKVAERKKLLESAAQ